MTASFLQSDTNNFPASSHHPWAAKMHPLYSLGVLSDKADQEQATVASQGKYVLLQYWKNYCKT